MFEGSDGGQNSLVKYNPLSNVSSAEVWNFLRVMVRPTHWGSCCLRLWGLACTCRHFLTAC